MRNKGELAKRTWLEKRQNSAWMDRVIQKAWAGGNAPEK
jgi:hypothetical protein